MQHGGISRVYRYPWTFGIHSACRSFSRRKSLAGYYNGDKRQLRSFCGAALWRGICPQGRGLKEYDIPERWSSLSEYLGILSSRRPALNFITLAGHGNIRASVLGYKNRKPDLKELEKMQALLRETVDQGAIGLSTGLIYPPGVYSTTEELVDLLSSLSRLPDPQQYITRLTCAAKGTCWLNLSKRL